MRPRSDEHVFWVYCTLSEDFPNLTYPHHHNFLNDLGVTRKFGNFVVRCDHTDIAGVAVGHHVVNSPVVKAVSTQKTISEFRRELSHCKFCRYSFDGHRAFAVLAPWSIENHKHVCRRKSLDCFANRQACASNSV